MSEAQINSVNETAACQQPGFLKRILWVVTSPGKLMECLAEKPRILFGLILTALAMDTLYLIRLPLFKDFLRSSTLASSDYMESLTGRTMTAEMVEKSLPAAMTSTLVSTPITMVIVMLFMTLIFFAVLKIMGGQGKFKAYLSVTGYSYVIPAFYILILIPVSFITGSIYQNVPLTSFATLMPEDMSGTFLHGLLKGLDVFSIWHYVVMAIGFTAVSRLKKTYVYIVVAAVFFIGLLIGGVGEMVMGALL